jgi:hypothetical protein
LETNSRREGAWLAVICVAVIATRWLARANTPDDPDSFGFVRGMSQRYDLQALQPHFPGYPVYIALGRILCLVGVSGLNAASAISAFSSGLACFGLFVCARNLFGARAAFAALALYAVAWLPWFLGGGAQSESLALALTLLAYASLLAPKPRPAVAGVLAGLVLGARASYWPLILSLVVMAWYTLHSREHRAWMLAGFGFGGLAWAIPFLAVVGIRPLFDLGTEHVRGHFGWWGGSIATQPNLLGRAHAFFRDWLFDGFAPSAWALAGVLAITVGALWRFRLNAAARSKEGTLGPATMLIAAVLAPYALWVFLAQNVAEQPRHVLPLIVGSFLPLGAVLARNLMALGAALALAIVANVPLVIERHRTPPAAGQAAQWIELHADRAETAIMADRSWRFFDALPGVIVRKHAWLSEVVVDLARFQHYPSAIWLTTEIDLHSGGGEEVPVPSLWTVEEGPSFCRDVRIDRAQPCLGLRTLRLNR